MITREATLAFFDNEMLGVVVEEEEYVALDGQSLANAFDGSHMQLARASNGQYRIIDDYNAEAYRFVNSVYVDERPIERGLVGAPWKFRTGQAEEVCDELEEIEHHTNRLEQKHRDVVAAIAAALTPTERS